MDIPGTYVVLDENEEDPLRNCRYQEREIRLALTESNMNIWTGSIPGPHGCVYEGGIWWRIRGGDRPLSGLSVSCVVFPSNSVLMTSFRFTAPKVLFKIR